MKKKFAGAVVIMALWAMGFYAWGRHDGVAKGAMEVPNVHIQWKGSEAAKAPESKAEVKPEVKDVSTKKVEETKKSGLY